MNRNVIDVLDFFFVAVIILVVHKINCVLTVSIYNRHHYGRDIIKLIISITPICVWNQTEIIKSLNCVSIALLSNINNTIIIH